MTEPEGPGDPQPQGEREDQPELDVDTAFAAIVAGFADPVPHGVGPWPASEDLDDPDDPDPTAPDPAAPDPAAPGPAAPGALAGGPGAPGAARMPGTAGPVRGTTPAGSVPSSLPPDTPPPAGPPEAAGRFPGSSWDAPSHHIVLPGDERGASLPRVPSDGDGNDEDEGYVPPEPPPFPRGDLVSRIAWGAVIGGPLFLLLAALLWRSLPPFLLLIALTAFVGGFVTLVARMPQEHPDDPDDGAVV